MTAINIERVVVVVIAIVHLDILYPHAVASQIVLHPATGVPESDATDGDILALDKTDEMGTGREQNKGNAFLFCRDTVISWN